MHDITLRPILFQFHDDGETTVHKLTTFDSTYENHNRIVLSTMNSMNPSSTAVE